MGLLTLCSRQCDSLSLNSPIYHLSAVELAAKLMTEITFNSFSVNGNSSSWVFKFHLCSQYLHIFSATFWLQSSWVPSCVCFYGTTSPPFFHTLLKVATDPNNIINSIQLNEVCALWVIIMIHDKCLRKELSEKRVVDRSIWLADIL